MGVSTSVGAHPLGGRWAGGRSRVFKAQPEAGGVEELIPVGDVGAAVVQVDSGGK